MYTFIKPCRAPLKLNAKREPDLKISEDPEYSPKKMHNWPKFKKRKNVQHHL